MKHLLGGIGLVALSLSLVGSSAQASSQRTLTGMYQWDRQDGKEPVRAVFSAQGDNSWKVDFFFKFHGEDHVYGGTAEGNLSDGALKGKVMNEDRRRTFVFRGDFEEGEFFGRHAEVRRGSERHTGTITLRE